MSDEEREQAFLAGRTSMNAALRRVAPVTRSLFPTDSPRDAAQSSRRDPARDRGEASLYPVEDTDDE